MISEKTMDILGAIGFVFIAYVTVDMLFDIVKVIQ